MRQIGKRQICVSLFLPNLQDMSRNEWILIPLSSERLAMNWKWEAMDVGNNDKSFKLRSEIIPLTDGNGWRHLHMTRINCSCSPSPVFGRATQALASRHFATCIKSQIKSPPSRAQAVLQAGIPQVFNSLLKSLRRPFLLSGLSSKLQEFYVV
ncbi:hypothetical protein C8R45DRAFT_1071572 [Mycena sanguinolenta]|nr:hypothetical protein C8R45DRAFT_1071572 [Mycena sanguinolenta]